MTIKIKGEHFVLKLSAVFPLGTISIGKIGALLCPALVRSKFALEVNDRKSEIASMPDYDLVNITRNNETFNSNGLFPNGQTFTDMELGVKMARVMINYGCAVPVSPAAPAQFPGETKVTTPEKVKQPVKRGAKTKRAKARK